MRLEIFMAMKIQAMVFWFITPHSDVVGYQNFGIFHFTITSRTALEAN